MSDLLARLQSALPDHYRIERELDRGGMASVYVAEDLRHTRQVAIKVVLPDVAEGIGAERFLREIKVLARLQHPHILTLIDSGDADGLPFLVMPYVEGHSLRQRLDSGGPLPLEEALQITREVADALEYAHREGIIHRDVKPSNILLSERHAVVADFGIAAAFESASPDRLTRTGTSLGSPVYMSPEQAVGDRSVDPSSDIYSLGCVLYEMLSGQAPFGDASFHSLIGRKVAGSVPPIHEVTTGVPERVGAALARAMRVNPEDRYGTPAAFAQALQAAVVQPREVARRRLRTATIVGTLAVLAIAALWFRGRSDARGTALWASRQYAEISRLSEAGRGADALELAELVERRLPGDTILTGLMAQFAFPTNVRSEPPGARVYRQRLDAPGDEWDFVGVTPLEAMPVVWPVAFRMRIELEGHRTVELLQTALFNIPENPLKVVRLDADSTLSPEMVRIPGSPAESPPIRSFGLEPAADTIGFEDFFMDRYEVTNGQFKEFVDAGGYEDPAYWDLPASAPTGELDWENLKRLLEDRTGRPGPATWSLGTYPEGQADYPVTGVSWYEAAAYARFVDKELPTVRHWEQAIALLDSDSHVIVPASNTGSAGPRPVGEGSAMASLGVFDLVGNVREWCFNQSGQGRVTRGAAWMDASFEYLWVAPRSPLDRSDGNGIRLIRTFDADSTIDAMRRLASRVSVRDYSTETPVAQSEYEIFRRMYAYDPAPLNALVETVDTFPSWVREVVTFDLPYGERGGALLYLPMTRAAATQAVVFWGGSPILATNHPDQQWTGDFDFLVKSGRAVALPMFKGAYQRDDSLFSTTHPELLVRPGGTVLRDYRIRWIIDASRTIDYLKTRDDLETGDLGYFGVSWGGLTAPILLAVEPRIRVAALHVGGLTSLFRVLPEVDPINFITRVTTPVLMLNGEYDVVFPLETDQEPMFELWGTDPSHKKRYLATSGHYVPRDQLIKETLDWFDQYMGSVQN